MRRTLCATLSLVLLTACSGAVSTGTDAGTLEDLGALPTDTGFVSVCNSARQQCRMGEVCTAEQGQFRCRAASVLPPGASGCATVWCTAFDQCVDLRTSAAHCGSCGMPCPTGQRCSAGLCSAM